MTFLRAAFKRPRFRRTRGWLAAGAILTASLPTVASAHGTLRRSEPAADARLAVAPRELRLTFTEAVELPIARLTLTGPDGAMVALGPLALAPDSAQVLVTVVRGPLVAGRYTVAWQVAGRDGHPVRGRYAFTVLPGATGLASTPDTAPPPSGVGATPAGEAGAGVTAPGQAPPPAAHHSPVTFPESGDFGAESPAYVAVRWVTYLALMLVLGAAAFRLVVLRLLRRTGGGLAGPEFAAAAERRAARVGLWAAATLGAVALVRLYAQSVAMHGAADALDPTQVGTMLARTVWGWGWVLQLGAAAVAALGFGAARRGARVGWPVAAIAAATLAFTPALSGHAAAAPRLTTLAVLSDGLHVLGAGGWLGSLLVVLVAGVPAALALGGEHRGAGVAALIHAFSPTALGFAGMTALTGLFAAWLHLGWLGALWETSYGQILLVKLAVLSLVAGTGAYNWLRVRPSLGDGTGTARIRRSSTAELAVGAVVLLVTAVLVATPTPMDERLAAADAPVAPAR